jgi:hypothetical protein
LRECEWMRGDIYRTGKNVSASAASARVID